MVSMCSLCGKSEETSEHLYLSCHFACKIWSWIGSIIHHSIDLSSFKSILAVCDSGWSNQVKDTILAAIVNCVWIIWFCKNKLRFDNKAISFRSAISLIPASVSLSLATLPRAKCHHQYRTSKSLKCSQSKCMFAVLLKSRKSFSILLLATGIKPIQMAHQGEIRVGHLVVVSLETIELPHLVVLLSILVFLVLSMLN